MNALSHRDGRFIRVNDTIANLKQNLKQILHIQIYIVPDSNPGVFKDTLKLYIENPREVGRVISTLAHSYSKYNSAWQPKYVSHFR